MSAPPPRPTLLYDGDCAFCRRWARRLRSVTGDRAEYAPYQQAAGRFPELSYGELERSIRLIGRRGEVSSGAAAAFRTLALAPGWGWPAWLYEHAPGFAFVSEIGYRAVSRFRHRL